MKINFREAEEIRSFPDSGLREIIVEKRPELSFAPLFLVRYKKMCTIFRAYQKLSIFGKPDYLKEDY